MAAIPFASPGGVELAVDVYTVDGESNRSAVVLLGPGGWGYSSRDTVSGLAISLARQGLVVFVGDVRLACTDGGPLCGYHYPAPLADVHSLIQFATSHGAEYGARTGPIGVFGLSSGAQLALLAAFREAGASRPGAVVAWSAPTSFAKLASNRVAGPIITRYLGCGYARCPDRWRDASPSRTPRAPRRRRSSSRRPTIRRCRRRSHGRSTERCTRPERPRNSTSSQARPTPNSAPAPSAVAPSSCSGTSPDALGSDYPVKPRSPRDLKHERGFHSRRSASGARRLGKRLGRPRNCFRALLQALSLLSSRRPNAPPGAAFDPQVDRVVRPPFRNGFAGPGD